MFKFYSSYALLYTGITHLLCCGVPIFIGITSVLSNLVFFEMILHRLEFLEFFEIPLLIITTSLFLAIISIEIYNRKIKCSDDPECCTEEECNTTKKKFKFNIIFSSVLYLLNCSIFLVEATS